MAYVSLSTANLPDPAIDPALGASPADNFNVVTYTGNGSTQSVTGVGFQPDFVWTKNRSDAYQHAKYDVVRGVTKKIKSNSGDAESTASGVTSFDSDGFSIGSDGGSNISSDNYVAWNWKAGGTAVSNTNGSITSTVSANTDAGFSIVGYTGTGSGPATIGHGLSSAPEMVIVKNRDGVSNWSVYHKQTSTPDNGDDFIIYLNSTSVRSNNATFWNDTHPTSSVFTINTNSDVNTNNHDFIAYCFHSVDGFSKVASYVGNGSADGPFVYTGFKPRFLLVKRTNGANSSWYIWDTERDPDNPLGLVLLPNGPSAEINYTSTYPFDFLSNGFKVRATAAAFNNSGNNYIFYSAAEQPFKYATAR